MITLENCAGQCCSHTRHLGVCAHHYECHYHSEKAAQESREQAWRDFINGDGPPPERPNRNVIDRRTR